MRKILIITVGGSHQPIVHSIQQNQADFVHFLCSGDSDKVKGSYTQVIGQGIVLKSHPGLDKPDLPNIATLGDLREETYQIHHTEHFDNLNDCYLEASQLIEELHNQYPTATLIVDYTGGTKSMAAGLVAAALDDGRCEIKLVTGLRQDLKQVTDRTEFVRPVAYRDMQVRRRMKFAGELIARFDYSSAERMLAEAATQFASDETEGLLRRWLALCRTFDAWDKFDHDIAQQLLQPYRGQFMPHAIFLDALLGKNPHGFEFVEDLLMNAQRRAKQERYDDAVGRLYRAVELTAQVWLEQRHGIDTSQVNLAAVPDDIRARTEKERDEKGVIKIGLRLAWEVIATFPDDVLGQYFKPNRNRLISFLTVRNQSLFAHGLNPIRQTDYRQHAPAVITFVQKAVDRAIKALGKNRKVKLSQLPTEWE